MATLNINYSYVNAGEVPGSEFDSERSDYGDGEAEDIEEVEEEYADPDSGFLRKNILFQYLKKWKN